MNLVKRAATSESNGASRGVLPHVVHVVVRVLAILIGLPLSLVSVMAAVGLVTSSLPAHLGIASAIVVAVPAVAVARLFPDRPKEEANSFSWDVLAILWLAIATGFVGIAQPHTKLWLRAEAALLSEFGFLEVAHIIEFVAAVRPALVVPPTEVEPPAVASGGLRAVPPPTAGFSIPAPPFAPFELADDGSTAPRPEQELSLDEVFDKVAPSLVTVVVDGPDGYLSASGFFIDKQGTVLTSKRIVTGASSIGVKKHDGTWVRGGTKVIDDENVRHALVLTDSDELTPAISIPTAFTHVPGTVVMGFACPVGLGHTRWVSRITSASADSLTVQDPVPAHRDGSPILNRFGELLGMVSEFNSDAQGTGSGPSLISSARIRTTLERRDVRPRLLGALPDEAAF